MDTVFEPFRIKSVEPIRVTSRLEREALIEKSYFNVALLKSDDVIIDLLTDSGTTAMSSRQWASLQLGDESYVRSPAFHHFQESVSHLFPFKHVIPTHQGRAADRLLATVVGKKNSIIPNNAHFDTTRANFEHFEVTSMDLEIDEANDLDSVYPFKGNMNIKKLSELLESFHSKIPLVMLTLTSNKMGGQPVSMSNIRKTSELCKQYKIPLFFDSCRFAENAYLIKTREPGYGNLGIKDIVYEMFSYADGMTMSAKKDVLVNTGGWLALNDDDWATKAMNQLLMTEGFVTYGGLCGRDLEAIAVGLEESIEEDYLRYRIESTEELGRALLKKGIPVVVPTGGHAVLIDVIKMLPHVPIEFNPGQALTVALYVMGGIRSCQLGSAKLDSPNKFESNISSILLRLAIPRRVYTQGHLNYVVDIFDQVNKEKRGIKGFVMEQEPNPLQYYAARYRPVDL